MFGFRSLRITSDAAFSSDVREVGPPGNHFVNIALVSSVKNDSVVW